LNGGVLRRPGGAWLFPDGESLRPLGRITDDRTRADRRGRSITLHRQPNS